MAVYGVFVSYVHSVVLAGGRPILVPPEPRENLEFADGVLLTGGEDVGDLSLWSGNAPTEPIDRERDQAELRIARDAIDKGLPLLGICRGAQIANCALGGRIDRIPSENAVTHAGENNSGNSHSVSIDQGSLLSEIHKKEEIFVQSRHSSTVSILGKGLVACAWAKDGQVEAVESTNSPFIGVLWHPEWTNEINEKCSPEIAWLVNTSHRRSNA
jgi:putative glutamine amidotransferase